MKPRTIVAVLQPLSAAKDVALTRALGLARWYESDLHVVHVVPSERVEQTGGDALRAQVVQRVAGIAASSGATGVDITTAVISNEPVRAVADYSSRVDADLVVVGKKARPSSGYWSAGSFAAALARVVKSPTVAVPSRPAQPAERGVPFRNILAAIDFSHASFRALSEALILAQQSGGHLSLLHVLDDFPDETVYSGSRAYRLMRDFRARVDKINGELQSLIPADASNWSEIEVATVSGKAHDAILAAASERSIDLIVLGLPRRPRLEQFVAGSTVHGVLRRATSPVLLVPGPASARPFRLADEHDVRSAERPSALGLHASAM